MQPNILIKTLFSGFFFAYMFFPATNIAVKFLTVYCIYILYILENGYISSGNDVIEKYLWIVNCDHVINDNEGKSYIKVDIFH